MNKIQGNNRFIRIVLTILIGGEVDLHIGLFVGLEIGAWSPLLLGLKATLACQYHLNLTGCVLVADLFLDAQDLFRLLLGDLLYG